MKDQVREWIEGTKARDFEGNGWEMDSICSTESGGVTKGKMDARDKDEIR